jgi:hypothetical protein
MLVFALRGSAIAFLPFLAQLQLHLLQADQHDSLNPDICLCKKQAKEIGV